MSKFSNLKVDRGTIEVNEITSVYLGTSQTDITSGVITKVQLDTEIYDPNSRFDTSNYKFVVVKEGYYMINTKVTWSASVVDKKYTSFIYKNGVADTRSIQHSSRVDNLDILNVNILYLDKNDYVELFTLHNEGVNTPDILAGKNNTYMQVHLLGT